jgi:hypothetical protein
MNKIFLCFLTILFSSAVFPQNVSPEELVFNFNYPGVFTGYKIQSNGTPQQIWQDPNDPNFVHAVFMQSSQTSGYTDRNGIYLFSDDMGLNWTNKGNIQTGSAACRGGYPVITGLNDGRPVAALHTNDSLASTTRTQIYVRNSQGTGSQDSWHR